MRISITFIALLVNFLAPALSLTSDGVVLLSFKYAVLADPLGVLDSWNYDDASPCLWTGVSCKSGRVTSLVLPNSQLSGPVSPHLSLIQTLQEIDLSGNYFKGPLPLSILNASNLQKLSLADNSVSGEVPALIGMLPSLKLLNLSGKLPGGFKYVEVLDISSNSLTGSVPVNFGGEELQLLDLSKNKFSGSIPPQFAASIPGNATINLAFNTLTGEIPQTLSFLNQKSEAFAGNAGLCGKPLAVPCSIPSTLSIPPELNSSSPAIAAIPRIISSDPAESGDDDGRSRRLQPMAIAGIVVGDVAGLGLLAIVIFFVHQMKNKKENNSAKPTSDPPPAATKKAPETHQITIVDNLSPSPDHRHRHSAFSLFPCLPLRPEPDTSDCTSSDADLHHPPPSPIARTGVLVTLSDDAVIEMETLLKASAYVLGASGSSIVYKAVTQGGAAFAVRRIGDGCVKKMKEFEAQVRGVAKLRHPNLVRTLGFYWGQDEKLVIYELAAHGSLASALTRKQGASTVHLNLEARLRVARGLARGLAFIHDKKQAHGNVKPSNILLDAKLEPLISDLGLDRLIASPRPDFGSMRSTASREGLLESSASCSGSSPYAAASTSSSAAVSALISASPYHAPEALRSLKVSAKWDVYSFGVVLLELLTGKALHGFELAPWAAACFTAEEEERVLRMTDVSIRSDVALREDATLACFKLGFGCANLVPGKRPTMKEAVQALEKIVG
uniref:Protein kinase domain-containing protein n=1 Tax=Kalanchoe fedtschenkoi TaxID=63787 RepID=A0A7N0UEJ8_KALFE